MEIFVTYFGNHYPKWCCCCFAWAYIVSVTPASKCSQTATKWATSKPVTPLADHSGHIEEEGDMQDHRSWSLRVLVSQSQISVCTLVGSKASPDTGLWWRKVQHVLQVPKWLMVKIPSGWGVPIMSQQNPIWLITMRMQVHSLASLSGLKILCCCELLCRSQTQLGSYILVALA